MTFRRLFTLLIISSALLFGQQENELDLDDEKYYIYERTAKNESEIPAMEDEARAGLVKTISSSVETGTEVILEGDRTTTVNDGEKTISSTTNSSIISKTKSTSALTLLNVKIRRKVLSDKRIRITAYVSHEDVEKSFKVVDTKITAQVKSANEYDRKNQTDAALQNYLEALSMQAGTTSVISYTDLDGKTHSDIFVYVKNRLEELLKSITLKVEKVVVPPQEENNKIVLTVAFYQKGRKISEGLAVKFSTNVGTTAKLIDGKAELFLVVMPDAKKKSYKLDFYPILKADEAGKSPAALRTVETEIDFSSIATVELKGTIGDNGDCVFEVFKQNIYLENPEWSFGDGSDGTKKFVIDHRYSDTGKNYEVVVAFKGSSLVLNGYVDFKNKTFSKTKPGSKKQSVPAGQTANSADADRYLKNPIIANLLTKSGNDILQTLTEYKNQSRVVFGRQDIFIKPQRAMIIFIDRTDKSLKGFLTETLDESELRLDLVTKTTIPDFTASYKETITIWLQIK